MVRTQISLTPEQHAAVTRLASDRSESMSAVIRDAVDRLVALSEQTAWQAMAEAVGQFDSGLGDLAERHDHYLDEG